MGVPYYLETHGTTYKLISNKHAHACLHASCFIVVHTRGAHAIRNYKAMPDISK